MNVVGLGRTALSIAYESSQHEWTQFERECARLIETKLRSQRALVYGGVLQKAGDARALLMGAFMAIATSTPRQAGQVRSGGTDPLGTDAGMRSVSSTIPPSTGEIGASMLDR